MLILHLLPLVAAFFRQIINCHTGIVVIMCYRVNQGIIYPLPQGRVFIPLKLFDTPTLEVLRVLTRILVVSMLFSAIGGYSGSRNYYSRVY